jgi:hypothetical protein
MVTFAAQPKLRQERRADHQRRRADHGDENIKAAADVTFQVNGMGFAHKFKSGQI